MTVSENGVYSRNGQFLLENHDELVDLGVPIIRPVDRGTVDPLLWERSHHPIVRGANRWFLSDGFVTGYVHSIWLIQPYHYYS